MIDGATMTLLAVLPLAACASAFFSGAETVLFGLSAHDRWQIQRDHPAAGQRLDALLEHPRRLLLTLLIGNVTVNSIWFAVGTVAVSDASLPVWVTVALGVLQVLVLVVFGEVVPKIVGNTLRVRLAPVVASPALLVYRVITPVRAIVERVVFDALNAISRESLAAGRSTAEEIGEAVRAAGTDAGITPDEAALLGRLVLLKRKRVRDVMTPRRQVTSVGRGARREDVVATSARSGLKRLPVVERNIDAIGGILDVRAYLLDARGEATPLEAHTRPAQFVPEIASLDQLLDLFRSRQCSLMVVVDEYGGTAGIVALEDAVEEIVGDIAAQGELAPADPIQLADGSWTVDGEMAADAFCAHFGVEGELTRASTVTGIVIEALGELPKVGEAFDLGPIRLRVSRTAAHRATEVTVSVNGLPERRGRRPR